MDSDDITPDIRENPWLANWKDIAKKTVESGFNHRRIRAETRNKIAIYCPANLWIASSPFIEPIQVFPEEPLVLYTKEIPETWISSSGFLRCQSAAWIFIPWKNRNFP
jgi:hypothetical protein